MVLVLRSAPRVGVHTCPLLLVLVTLICSHHISYVVGVLPTPSYDLQWDTVGEATGATRAIWSAGTFPHDGIVSTNDDSQGGFISPTFPSSTVTLTFPFTIRVGVIIKPTQVAINQWQRIWSFHNGVGGADVVSIQHYQNTNDLFMEFVAGGPQTSRQFTNSWDLLDDGAWHDLIFTATSTTDVKLWIDSVQQTETNVVTTNPGSAFITTAKGVYLGKSSFGDAPPNAAWDFLEIYPQAFTQTQVDEAFDEFVGTIGGDPQIAGFQGQDFQFHGIPGEMFNLITSPTFQLNSKFVYLASGSCQYNHTQCWSHPGTYLSHLGFMIPDHHVQLVAGSHQQGLSLHIDGKQVHNDMIDNTTTTHIYELGNDHISMNINHISNERVKLSVPSFDIIVINSDMFFNLMIAVTDPTLLQSGSKQHHYRQHHVTSAEYVYPAIPIHGLTGQTWRNAQYGPDHQLYEGEPDDYLLESQNLFGCDFKFNQYRGQGCQQA